MARAMPDKAPRWGWPAGIGLRDLARAASWSNDRNNLEKAGRDKHEPRHQRRSKIDST